MPAPGLSELLQVSTYAIGAVAALAFFPDLSAGFLKASASDRQQSADVAWRLFSCAMAGLSVIHYHGAPVVDPKGRRAILYGTGTALSMMCAVLLGSTINSFSMKVFAALLVCGGFTGAFAFFVYGTPDKTTFSNKLEQRVIFLEDKLRASERDLQQASREKTDMQRRIEQSQAETVQQQRKFDDFKRSQASEKPSKQQSPLIIPAPTPSSSNVQQLKDKLAAAQQETAELRNELAALRSEPKAAKAATHVESAASPPHVAAKPASNQAARLHNDAEAEAAAKRAKKDALAKQQRDAAKAKAAQEKADIERILKAGF